MLLMDAKLYILASIIREFGSKPLQVEVRGQFFAIIWTHFDDEIDSSTLDHNIKTQNCTLLMNATGCPVKKTLVKNQHL